MVNAGEAQNEIEVESFAAGLVGSAPTQMAMVGEPAPDFDMPSTRNLDILNKENVKDSAELGRKASAFHSVS